MARFGQPNHFSHLPGGVEGIQHKTEAAAFEVTTEGIWSRRTITALPVGTSDQSA